MNGNTIDDDGGAQQSVWAGLPVFVDHGADYIDGWKPAQPIGDAALDFMTGELYADIAVKHARHVKDQKFIGFVLAAIYFKTTRGIIQMGDIEQGFLDRLARFAYAGSMN